MQLPIEIALGSSSFHLHQPFEILGMFFGFRLFLNLKKNTYDPLNSSERLWVLVGATVGALLGARLLATFENTALWFDPQVSWWQILANKTLVGGLLGGLIGVESIKRFKGITTSSGDLFVYPLLLAIFIGRIGCFSMGTLEDTYGTETRCMLGMNLGDGLNRHPVTLYEMAFVAMLALVLFFIEKKGKLQNGYRFKIFLSAYLAFRLALDFIKPTHEFALGLSAIQWACLLGLLYYTKSLYVLLFKNHTIRLS